jgi:hypothetical protein
VYQHPATASQLAADRRAELLRLAQQTHLRREVKRHRRRR